MRLRLRGGSLMLLLFTLLSGCGGEADTVEAAMASAQRFMEAQGSADAGAVWGALSGRAQRSMSRNQVNQYLKQEQIAFAALGSPLQLEDGVVRIPVLDLEQSSRYRTVQWPEGWLTLRREGDRWRVAWAEPLFAEAAEASQNSAFVDQLRLGQSIVAIDPHHYRGHLELHYAYRGLQRYREAEIALVQASDRATTIQQPDVLDATARFKFALNRPAEALHFAQQALALASPHIPATYSVRWQADILVFASKAARALGDQSQAEVLMAQAAEVDPDNPALAIYRHQLEPAIPVIGH